MKVRTAIGCAAAMILGVLLTASARAGTSAYTFKFTPSAAPTSVSVAGDFNNWSTTANPMTKGADGVYTATVDLSEGDHAYKFVVDNAWMNDPSADPKLDKPDGQGGSNSVVHVGGAAADAAAKPVAAVPAGSAAHVFHFTPAAGTRAATKVFVAGDFNDWSTTSNPMDRAADGSYSATVVVTSGVHHYKYVIDGTWTPDPAADASLNADDGNGGQNSGFTTDATAK